MSLLAATLLGLSALPLHLMLMLLVAPLAAALVDAASTGDRPPGPWRAVLSQPLLDLRDLMRRQPIRAGNASPLAVAAPRLALALALVSSALVPSFATGLASAPVADLFLILALLGLGQGVLILAAMDEGLAAPGLAAVGQTVSLLLAAPGALLSVCALAVLAGGTDLDTILASQRAAGWLTLPTPAGLAAGLALGLVPLATAGRRDLLSQQSSGPDLAVALTHDAVVLLVWLDLATGLILPGSLASAQSGPLQWLLGLLLWLVRIGFGCVAIGVLRPRLEPLAARRRLAGLSVILALLAPILSMIGRS